MMREEEGGRFDPKVEHMREIEERFNQFEGGWPEDDWWTKKGSWHLAVDGKGIETCWESWLRTFISFHFVPPLLFSLLWLELETYSN
jgi:hypothetical protein